MKKIILLLLTICFAITINAQIKYAFTYNSYLGYQKNVALITKATIELKGYEWYEQYILKNIVDQKLKLIAVSIIFYPNGTYKLIMRNGVLPEIKNAIPQILSYIGQNKCIIYGHDKNASPTSSINVKKLFIKNLITNSDISIEYKSIETLVNFYYGAIEMLPNKYKYINDIKQNKINSTTNFWNWFNLNLTDILETPIKTYIGYDTSDNEFF